jgi:hypothetical protein
MQVHSTVALASMHCCAQQVSCRRNRLKDLTSSLSQISLTLRGRRGHRNPASLNLTATMLLSHKARLFSDKHLSSSMAVEGGRGFLPKCRSSAFAWMSRTWYKEETMADLVISFCTAHIVATSFNLVSYRFLQDEVFCLCCPGHHRGQHVGSKQHELLRLHHQWQPSARPPNSRHDPSRFPRLRGLALDRHIGLQQIRQRLGSSFSFDRHVYVGRACQQHREHRAWCPQTRSAAVRSLERSSARLEPLLPTENRRL